MTDVRKREWKAKAFKKSSKCRYCKATMDIGGGGWFEATVDHRIPKSAGGANHPSNYILCCRRCNSEKADMPYKDFLMMVRKEGGA